jgi:hypothetical protein
MANLNNEGFTMATESTCVAGFKAVFYADDDSDAGHAIRRIRSRAAPSFNNVGSVTVRPVG